MSDFSGRQQAESKETKNAHISNGELQYKKNETSQRVKRA
jgi:hypothetical protein